MYKIEDVSNFVKQVLIKIGCSEEDALLGAEVLMVAELRGISSHGLMRLKDYVQLWEQKRINTSPIIKITHETPSTAVVDGDSGLGIVVAPRAMKIAIEKAKIAGTGWVAMNNSNHYSIAGYHAMMALEHDMIGISMTNANPLVAPTFSVDRFLGTNPIAVAIPAGKYPPFVADFATTGIARGKLDILAQKKQEAPDLFVQDKYGKISKDPNVIKDGGALLPLGGDRLHGSNKGYCLGGIVDIFSAILSGAHFGPWVPPSVAFLPVKPKEGGLGTGHFFGAMRIDAFQTKEEFKTRMDEWIETFKNARPAEGIERVMVPGEPEAEMEIKIRKEGIVILDKVLEDLKQLSEQFEVKMF